jgi:5-methylphenazine-1-carboxylate 1-monooxygenase
MKVIICGGGIGGLVAAMSLHQAGFEVHVYEAASQMKPLGVGINIQPHAVRELFELGFESMMPKIGVRTKEVMYANRYGTEIWREPRGQFAGYHWPQFSVHRGKLQMMLWDASVERLGAQRIHTDRAVERFEQTADQVTAHFVARDGERFTDSADLLIGADGIHSKIRAQLYPEEGAPKWGGAILWRGMTRAKPFQSHATMAMCGYSAHKFVTYPISEVGADGLQDINWIGELAFKDRPYLRREDWNRSAVVAEFMPSFASWQFDWLNVPELMSGADSVFEFPMVDRDPLPRWSHDRITLLGDAAHPMYPIGSNGASQSIVDGRVLASKLTLEHDPILALQQYDDERRPVTSKIVFANRANGPDQAMEIAHIRAPDGFKHINDIISQTELIDLAAAYKKMAGFDREALNAKAAFPIYPRAAMRP